MEAVIWNREELYEKVWSMPVVKVAKEYGVSDVAIAKTCRKLQVPVPGRGYWAKKAHGYIVPRKPLPKLKEPVVISRNTPPILAASPLSPALHLDDKVEFDRIDALATSGKFAFVQNRKALRHPLVVKAREALREGHLDERKILHPPYRAAVLNIRVSRASVSRALAWLSNLILVSKDKGRMYK